MINKDYYFEFAGMPKSGKTTVCDIVAHYLKRSGYFVESFHGGGRYAPIDKASLVSLNLYLACKAVEFLITTIEREKTRHRIYLLDRGLIDRCIFTRVLFDLGKIEKNEAKVITDALKLQQLAKVMDYTFIFITSPELSMHRENVNKLTPNAGRVMNTEFLHKLQIATTTEISSFPPSFSKYTIVNTEKMNNDIQGCAKMVAQIIENTIHES